MKVVRRVEENGVRSEHESRPEVRHRDGVFDVKDTLPTVIEQAEGRVAPLLELGNDEACTNRVNRPRGHENHVVCGYGSPHNKVRDRPVLDGRTQFEKVIGEDRALPVRE